MERMMYDTSICFITVGQNTIYAKQFDNCHCLLSSTLLVAILFVCHKVFEVHQYVFVIISVLLLVKYDSDVRLHWKV